MKGSIERVVSRGSHPRLLSDSCTDMIRNHLGKSLGSALLRAAMGNARQSLHHRESTLLFFAELTSPQNLTSLTLR